MPAIPSGKQRNAHDSLVKRTPYRVQLQSAEHVRLPAPQVRERHLRRAEQTRVHLVEVAPAALEQLAEERPVIGRHRGWHFRADSCDLGVFCLYPQYDPATVYDGVVDTTHRR